MRIKVKKIKMNSNGDSAISRVANKVSAHIVVQGFVKLQKSVLCAGGKRLR